MNTTRKHRLLSSYHWLRIVGDSKGKYVVPASRIVTADYESLTLHSGEEMIHAHRLHTPLKHEDQTLRVEVSDGRSFQIAANCQATVELANGQCLHLLNARHGEKLGAEFRSLFGDGIGLSIDGVPARHSLFDPMYQLRQGMIGLRVIMILVAISLAYGYASAIYQQNGWLGAQIAYGVPYFVAENSLRRFKRHHGAAFLTVIFLTLLEAFVYLSAVFAGVDIVPVVHVPVVLIFVALRVAAIAFLLRGLHAAMTVAAIDRQILCSIGIETHHHALVHSGHSWSSS